MVADTIDELHTFAQSIGVKRHWFHKDHYDVREEDHGLAIDRGAILVSSKEIATIRKRLNEA